MNYENLVPRFICGRAKFWWKVTGSFVGIVQVEWKSFFFIKNEKNQKIWFWKKIKLNHLFVQSESVFFFSKYFFFLRKLIKHRKEDFRAEFYFAVSPFSPPWLDTFYYWKSRGLEESIILLTDKMWEEFVSSSFLCIITFKLLDLHPTKNYFHPNVGQFRNPALTPPQTKEYSFPQ